MLSELLELNQIRLDDDLTYEQLAESIGVHPSALVRLLNSPNRRPIDRTLHKIRRFLDERKAAAAGATPRRKAASR